MHVERKQCGSSERSMASTDETFTWGYDTQSRGGRAPVERPSSTGSVRRASLLGVRMAAIAIDSCVLVIPLLVAAYLASVVFPGHGFFIARSGLVTETSASGISRTRYTYALPASSLILITTLGLAYFFVCEAVWERTVGKRTMGVRVRSAGGARAGLGAIAGRTILRLIDGIAFYLVGWLVALLTGSRRRRIGDWAGGTVVIREEAMLEREAPRSLRRVLPYPAACVAGVLVAVLALGVDTPSGRDAQAIALVQSYVAAREHGDAALACSMLTSGQQQEIVAIESGSYERAQAARCPAYILREEPDSHLLNPGLRALAASNLNAEADPLGAIVVSSPQIPSLRLIAISEGGRLMLDMRGVEKLQFLRECTSIGRVGVPECACTFDLARAQARLPEGPLTLVDARAIAADAGRCRGDRNSVIA
jgi:uncharacterized RDD family membrane protein YckC